MSPGPGTGHLCVCLCDSRWRGESVPARTQQSADRGNEWWVWVSMEMILFSGTYCQNPATHCDFNNIIKFTASHTSQHEVRCVQSARSNANWTELKRHQRHSLVSWRMSQQQSRREMVTPKFWHCPNFITVYLRSNGCDSRVCTCLTLRTSG